MISREEQHAFEMEYRYAGSIHRVSDSSWKVSLFEGIDKEEFKTAEEAISFAKRKTMVFQKNKQIGLSVKFHKKGGRTTYLLFPNAKTINPFEVSSFYWNQIQVNVDGKERAKKMDQVRPIKVSFNDIARVSAYISPRKVKRLSVPSIIAIISMVVFVVAMFIFMLLPNESSKILAIATGLKYRSIPGLVTGFFSATFGIAAIGLLFHPTYKFWKNARDDSGGYSYEGKIWKKQYLDRVLTNRISFGLILVSVLLSIMNNYFISDTTFFSSVVHTPRSIIMITFLVLMDISLIFIASLVVWQNITTTKKNKRYLKKHIDPDDVELFKAWTTHNRIKSKEYFYDYLAHFTFPPTMERLRVISEEIYVKKLRVSEKTKAAKAKDLKDRYFAGLKIYKDNARSNKRKQGI